MGTACRDFEQLHHINRSRQVAIFKRFNAHSMRTKFRFLADPQVKEISMGELQMFFEGSAYTVDKRLTD